MSTAEGIDGRRAIGERNADSIMEAALRLFAEQPEAGMGEIASAAGVGRATVYRHFATRDDLIDALRKQAAEEVRAIIADAVEAGRDDARTGLEHFATAIVGVSERYAVIAPDRRKYQAAAARLHHPLVDMVRRGQEAGQLDASVSAHYVVGALRGLLMAGRDEQRARRMSREDVAATAMRSLLSGLASG